MSFGAIAIGAATVGSAAIGAHAAKKASKAQTKAADASLAEQRREYDLGREDLAPYRQAGTTALSQIGAGTADGGDFNRDFTLADFNADPGYQFRMDEGTKALDRSASARGGVLSGAALKAIGRYGQDYASGEYNNAYNRFNADRDRRFGRLSQLAGIGQTATNTGVQAGQNYANSSSDIMLQRGNASAAGTVGASNAITNGVQTLGNLYLNSRYGYKPPTPSPGWYKGNLPSEVVGYQP